ncbi:MAG TPA: alpha/beta fold hydrolase, partial [Opitutales bacterium]|nr:alpha/beta fold hydrolase [Opitutales bacterium]
KIPVGNLASDEKRILILKLEMTIPPIAKRKSSDADLLEIEATFESHRSHPKVSHKWNRVVKTRFTNRRDEPKSSPDATGFISAQLAGKTLCEAVADAESGRIFEAKTRLKTKIRHLEKEPPSNGRSDGLKLLTEFYGILKAKGKWTARDQKRARYRCHYYRKMSSKELWLGPRNQAPTFSRPNRKPSARASKIKTTVPPNFFCLLSELQVQSRSNQKQMMTHYVSRKIFSFLLLTLFSAFPLFATSESSFGTLGNYNLSTLLESNIPPPLLGDEIDSVEKWEAKAAEIREIWVDYIGGIPERVPVEFEILETSSEKDHDRIKLVFQTVHDDQIPAYLLLPKGIEDSGQKYPAILALHPTNAEGKDSIATPWSRPNRQYAFELVSRGYVVLAPDAMTSGDRIFENERHFRSAPFYEKHPEWSTVAKNIVDHMQAVDLLESLPYVDSNRIGTIGHSFGGYNAYFLTSIDPRIAVAVSSCGFNPFTGSSNPQHWGIRNWYTHLPRFSEDMENNRAPFDFHEIAALTAPRPFLNYSTQQDHIFPDWRPIAESMADLHKLYSLFDANDRFRSILTSGGHDFPPDIREIAYDFLDQWLKK